MNLIKQDINIFEKNSVVSKKYSLLDEEFEVRPNKWCNNLSKLQWTNSTHW